MVEPFICDCEDYCGYFRDFANILYYRYEDGHVCFYDDYKREWRDFNSQISVILEPCRQTDPDEVPES